MRWGMPILVCAIPLSALGQVTVSRTKPPVIVTAPNPTAQESLAANELAKHLGAMLGATVAPGQEANPGEGRIVVGLASKWAPEAKLGPEDVLIRTRANRLYVLGGGPRGAIYAVNRLLHRQGVRWWTPWATTIPKKSRIEFKDLNVTESPRFESRDPFWYHAFDREWARRNGSNSMHARLTEEDGGKIVYSGFVHTFFPFVPPEKHFKDHPEWYSMIGGVRKWEGAQLCTSNPDMRRVLVEEVKTRLRQDPSARIVSVSQNDWYGACECPSCKALSDEEGSLAAPVLDLANYVADQIRDEFPEVAVDTLAYQYTRKAPKSLRPRPNVIVRLCSIECDFSKPLTDPANASFAQDIRDWSRLTNRLYVWNYVTDFPNYMMPFPNWDVIGPNQRFFAENGVKGLFEQGAYQSFGGTMAEMHAWTQAQLLWNPHQDDRALRKEFLNGYYGAAAGPISATMDLLAKAAKPVPMNIWIGPNAPFFDTKTVLAAELLWQDAERRVARRPDLLWRVRIGHLGIRYVILSQWGRLRREAPTLKIAWPLPESRKAVADEWIAVATGPGPAGWSAITHMNESGLTPQSWIERFAVDPAALPIRPKISPLPADLVVPDGAEVVLAQDDEALLIGEGNLIELRPDPAASDGLACRLPGGHREWAFQLAAPKAVRKGTWKVYVQIRVEPGEAPGAVAYTAGVYSTNAKQGLGDVRVTNADAGTGYRTVLLATTPLTEGCYVWAAPADGGSRAVWVDRVIFVREP
ncbi:MAG: DUF4838 domain-containing protein [Fimbriimonadaceae bacterium]|nr:DUF4838 domain-containing protein [Fimbriimonadaceae bacterium]